MEFRNGGYQQAPDNSSIGRQINDKFWSKAAVIEAAKKKVFSQLGDKETQPKHYGKKLAKYHNIPILDERNINDQGIDANGVKIIPGVWYAYDVDGSRITDGADADDGQGYSTKQKALQALKKRTGSIDKGQIKSGNGNLFGSSRDILVQNGAFPILSEHGGAVNRVGMKRILLEGEIEEFGFYVGFTKEALEMDTEIKLLARIVKEVGTAQGDIREAQIRNALIGKSEENRVYAGYATSMDEMGSNEIVTFEDLRMMDQSLKMARCPIDTKIIDGSTKYGTVTVGDSRYCYVGQEAKATLEDMTHNGKSVWTPVSEYAYSGMIASGEIGKIGSIRFIEVPDGFPNYSGQGAVADDGVDDAEANNRYTSTGYDGKLRYDVFPMLFVGSGSFATIGFEGDVARVKAILPKADALNDVYGKNGAVSISWYFGMLYLRPEWIRQIVTTYKIN